MARPVERCRGLENVFGNRFSMQGPSGGSFKKSKIVWKKLCPETKVTQAAKLILILATILKNVVTNPYDFCRYKTETPQPVIRINWSNVKEEFGSDFTYPRSVLFMFEVSFWTLTPDVVAVSVETPLAGPPAAKTTDELADPFLVLPPPTAEKFNI